MKYSSTMPVTLCAFDFLFLNDRKLIRNGPEERKSLLKGILTESSSLKYSNHVEMNGESFYDNARECMKFWRKAGS